MMVKKGGILTVTKGNACFTKSRIDWACVRCTFITGFHRIWLNESGGSLTAFFAFIGACYPLLLLNKG
jgi:hypothetical protein